MPGRDGHLDVRMGGDAAKAHWHVYAIRLLASLREMIEAVDGKESAGRWSVESS